MSLRLLPALILLLGFASCEEEVMQKPENLIPGNTMSEILYDLALINAAKSTNPAILQENHIELMEYIYDKYGIDSAQFVNSDTYYASKPNVYETIYERVKTRLEREKEAFEEERKRVSDSIRIEAEERRKAAADSASAR